MENNQWLKLVEYGDHPHPEGVQRVTQVAAEEMQRKFRSLRARLARKFGGVPIYIGHPDDKNYSFLPGHSDTRSYAWVQDIEARSDGIWILPKWSDAGRAMVEHSFFKFLSPRWEMRQEGAVLIPVRLISVGLTNNPNILGDAIANQKNAIVKQKNTHFRRRNSNTTVAEEVLVSANFKRKNPNATIAKEVLAGANISDAAVAGQIDAAANPTNIATDPAKIAATRKNPKAAAGEEVLAGANFRQKNSNTSVAEEALASANISDAATDSAKIAATQKNPNAAASDGEISAKFTEKKKGKSAKKIAPEFKQSEIPQNEIQQSEIQWDENPFPQQRLNDLLERLFGVDFTKTWQEIETILTAKAKYAQLWTEEGEALKNNNRDLLSESERFYKIACEKELQVQELGEQLAAAKNLSGEYFVNFAVNRGLILPNEAGAWKEKYAANPHGASNDLLKQTCLLNTTSKTEHLRQFPSTPGGKDQILALVNERMETSGESYAEAWNAVKKIYPTLF